MKLLHSDATIGTYQFVHSLIFIIWVLIVATDPLHKLAVLPVTAFEPYGLLRFLPTEIGAWILDASALTAVRIGAVVCCGTALLRPTALWAKLAACVLLTLHQTIVRGFSVMNHAEIVALQAVYVFTAFDVLNRFAREEERENTSTRIVAYPLVTLTLLLSLTYFFAGLNRIVSSGLSGIWDGSVLAYFVDTSASTRRFDFDLSRHLLERPKLLPFLNAAFLVVTLAELGAPLCLISGRARRIIAPILVCFHILALVLMKVIFFPHGLLLILFSDISAWVGRLPHLAARRWCGALPVS